MAEQAISMPSGMGGLTRYFEDSEGKIKIKPGYVVAAVVVVLVIEAGLRLL